MAAIIVPIAIHFNNKDAAKSPEEKEQDAVDRAAEDAKWSEPSAWIGHFLEVFQYLYIIGIPGVFVRQAMCAS